MSRYSRYLRYRIPQYGREPQPPQKPEKKIKTRQLISSERLANYDTGSIPDGATSFYIELETEVDYGDTYCGGEIKFYKEVTEENKDYDKQLIEYNRKYKAYEEKHKKWEEKKNLHEQREGIKEIARKRKLFEELKKELGEN